MTTAGGGSCLAVLLLASACSAGPAPGPTTAGPEPTVEGVTVTPSQAVLTPGEVLRFQAAVTGKGSVPQGVRWTIATAPNGTPRDGWIEADGTYHAPQVVAATQVVIQAAAEASPGVLGTATIGLPARSLVIAPRSPEVPSGGTARFSFTTTGVLDARVEWTSDCGSIDPDGLFHAPVAPVTTWCFVQARCTNSGDGADVLVTVLPEPSRLSGTSGPAAAGEMLTIYGSGFSSGDCVVQFTSAWEPALAECVEGSGEVVVRVPPGALSGPIRVLESKGGTKLVASDALPFVRAPRLRLRAEQQDLSAGESTPLQLAFLGGGPVPVTFEADVGTVVEGRYVAPSTVTGMTFAKVRACAVGTVACTGIVLAVRPFRVIPEDPVVPSGASLVLGAQVGGAPVEASFSLRAGTGSVTASGEYVASSAASDAGPTWIDVTLGATMSEAVQIGVGGLVPGVVGRIQEHIDQRQGGEQGMTRWGVTADALAVAGSRLYVAAGNPEDTDCPGCFPVPDGSPSYYWIDTYDLSDPARPRWLGAVESATRPEGMFVAAGKLYVWSTHDDSVAVWREEFHFLLNLVASLAVYDLAGDLPALVNRHVYSPAAGGNYPVNNPPAHDAEQVFEFPPIDYSKPAFDVWVRPAADPLASPRKVHIDLPPPCTGAGGFAASGNRVYAPADCGPRETRILVFDISGETPVLVGSRDTTGQGGGRLVADGTRLVERGWNSTRLYEAASGTPVFLAELPVGGETAPVVEPGGRIVVVGQDRMGGTHGPTVIETGGPTGMLATTALYSGEHGRGVPIFGGPKHAPTGAALAGNHLYSAEGRAGVGIYDVGVAGGLVPRGALPPPSRACDWEALSAVVRQDRLYAAGAWYCPSEVGSFLAAWDLPTGSPGRPALAWEDYRSSLPDLMRLELGGPGLLLSSPDGVEIWSLADPAVPLPVASVALDGRTLAVVGNLAWVGTFPGELIALDIGDPASPVVVGRLDLGASVSAIRPLGGGRLAVGLSGSSTGDLVLVDGSAPASPIELGRAGLGVQVLDLDVDPASGLAVLATVSGMAAVDVSDPRRPVALAAEAMPPASPFGVSGAGLMPLTVKLADGLAWIGGRGRGTTYGWDMRDPSRPRLISSNGVTGITWVEQIAIDGSRLFVAGAGGIVQTDRSQPGNVVRTYRALDDLQR